MTQLLLLSACATQSDKAGVSGTIASLEGKSIEINIDAKKPVSRDKAIDSYKKFLAKQPDYPLRAEAMRRLADLEIEARDDDFARDVHKRTIKKQAKKARDLDDGTAKPANYKSAIKLYRGLLKAYPYYPGNDRVLYQLAKAYEHAGKPRSALKTLNKLVKKYPATQFFDEAQFRLGELHFVRKSYRNAEIAYLAVVQFGERSFFYERALFMSGWSQFKQANYKTTVNTFSAILDRKLAGKSYENVERVIKSMPRGDREMLDDSMRVMTLSFSYIRGATSMAEHYQNIGNRAYEYMMYQKLAELFLKQERVRDAAQTYAAFVNRYPNHERAPNSYLKMIKAFQQGRFASKVLETKEKFVTLFGIKSNYWSGADQQTRSRLRPHIQKHLKDLASFYHSRAQKKRSRADYAKAARWYRVRIESFPNSKKTAGINFLLAESLFESGQYLTAVAEYEKTAYDYPRHKRSREAGYAVLLAYKKQEALTKSKSDRLSIKNRFVDSSIRYADTFPRSKSTAGVLTKATEELYTMHSPDRAITLATRVVSRKPRSSAKYRKVAWTVIAHASFDRGDFERAEKGYRQILRLTNKKDKKRKSVETRLASTIYKQGEQQRSMGNTRVAVGHFLRVGRAVPTSSIRATAIYDAAAGLVKLKDWEKAAKTLEIFQRQYPNHKLQSKVIEKLAVIYLETGQSSRAARQFEAIAVSSKNPDVRREASLQAAELYKKSGKSAKSIKAYKNYVKRYPSPFEPAVEARQSLAELYKKKSDARNYAYWLKEVIRADSSGRNARTDRTKFLAATATFTLSEPYFKAFSRVKLVRPLKKSLAKKKTRMQEAIKAFTRAAEYGVADITTAATYRIAAIYQGLSVDLIKSQRPKGLSKEELEQYDILLEEQAFPFEEKAFEIHENNIKRAASGLYDKWVKRSYASLRKLRPIQYAKSEKSVRVVNDIH
jgi:TolA-binding protein